MLLRTIVRMTRLTKVVRNDFVTGPSKCVSSSESPADLIKPGPELRDGKTEIEYEPSFCSART